MKFSEEVEKLDDLKEEANSLREDIGLLMYYKKELLYRNGLMKLADYMKDDVSVSKELKSDKIFDYFSSNGINLDNINEIIDERIKKLSEINGAIKTAQEEMGDEYDRYKTNQREQRYSQGKH